MMCKHPRTIALLGALSLGLYGTVPFSRAATTQRMPNPPATQFRHEAVAFVDTGRILQDSAVAQAAQKKLKDEFAPQRQKLRAMADQIQALQTKLQVNSVVMSDSDRVDLQQKISDMIQDFQARQQEYEQDLNTQRNSLASQILEKAQGIVEQIAKRNGDVIVFQKAAYVSPRIDITDQVIQSLDGAGRSPGASPIVQ
jgi:outer membrane protein